MDLPAFLGHPVLEACSAPMIILERRPGDCLIRYVNPAFASRAGYSAAEITGVGWDGIHMDGGHEGGIMRLCAAIRDCQELEMPLRIRGKDGVTFSASLHVSPVVDAGSAARYAVGVLRERSADIEYVSRLERAAHYDPLTGLPNRRLLADRAERAIAQARRVRHVLGVAVIDLDGFKLVNDTFGHSIGDEVLCAAGARLARDLRAGDFVARVGGDEFVLLLQEPDGDFSLASIIERVRDRIQQPMHLHGQSVSIGCSIGLAVFPAHGEGLDTLLERADQAMYRQKARRRPRRAAERPAPRGNYRPAETFSSVV